MYSKKLVLGIYTISPVHAGSGSESSVIDLPIQREKHTGFPVIWGQSLKGVLRHAFEEKGVKKGAVHSIFGPPTERADDHAGAISVGDAKILLFPVRSARGVFAYVTSPLVLERFKRDMELAGKKVDFVVPNPGDGAIVDNSSRLTVDGNVILEEVVLEAKKEDLSSLEKALSDVLPGGVSVKERLAIVPDDVFSAFVRMNTEIVARIAIDPAKGTVRKGGLWYEEFLPSDTVLYSVIAVGKPKGGDLNSVEGVEGELTEFFKKNPYLQVGGDETVGKGFVRVKLAAVNGNGKEPNQG
ncbi:type III-B CRISPR module RAMP protein Cmr4 [Thermococcus waiotapuensis]|uniref:Type III-B CRISPR module RAMP protein Cmr4 n=1 Tax=Thermococcus waiotapuensis TaxID=90909 RepID=A0AAE4NYV6_9EURY|nr:type III-B CRISPR module RAMP protein Cmr4 [Thermococcus waiotapuensis]MDV3104836.1 type III-B CRISPR module RAMP protein Cmr4 [Thermococcus waiotapuensis]